MIWLGNFTGKASLNLPNNHLLHVPFMQCKVGTRCDHLGIGHFRTTRRTPPKYQSTRQHHSLCLASSSRLVSSRPRRLCFPPSLFTLVIDRSSLPLTTSLSDHSACPPSCKYASPHAGSPFRSRCPRPLAVRARFGISPPDMMNIFCRRVFVRLLYLL